ncbi:MAG: flagellin [Treponema sp.]|nr:flagellin [Treponema sp.]
MIINHNPSAMFAARSFGLKHTALGRNMERLSSGMRINRARDDAAGLAVSERMRAQIRGLNMAARNAQNGVSLIQTTEGFLQGTQNVLQRLRELAVQSANGVFTAQDRMFIQVEVSQLVAEIDRIANHAQFNGMNLLTGRFGRPIGENTPTASMWFHIGANMDQRIQAFIGTMTAAALGLRDLGDDSLISLAEQEDANRAIGTLDQALRLVSMQRANLGAYQNRLEFAIRSIEVGAENLQAAESRIRDTNMASEMVGFTRNMILSQAGLSMLAQANMRGQMAMQLLQSL